MAELTKRDRMHMERTQPNVRAPAERRTDFDEVSLGFTPAMAEREATRCLGCARPVCIEGCPVGVRIDQFIAHVANGDIAAARSIVAQDNFLPAVCGRVCPQNEQCEAACILAKKGRPIAIGYLERFVADSEPPRTSPEHTRTGSERRVAIVGSGPSGLACAGDLARCGHQVVVFEALHEVGGVLAYGIPEFRLPKAIVHREIRALERLGVTFETNVLIGSGTSLDDLLRIEGFDAAFIGTGAGLPRFLGVPGEDLIGVLSANEFLTRVNLMHAHTADGRTPIHDIAGRPVAVVGGGNTAIDAARTAIRLGGNPVSILYRRTKHEMPARAEEIEHAAEEGVAMHFLVAPVALEGVNDRVDHVVVQHMRLEDDGHDGRPRPVPIEGAFDRERADVVIVAVGNAPNPVLLRATPGLETTSRGTIAIDPASGATSMPGVFAGGDIATGGATVIQALGAGRRAATAIDAWLTRESSDEMRQL